LPSGSGRFDDDPARPRVALARSRRRGAALRHPRHRVLLADGAIRRRHPRRSRRRQEAARGAHGHPPRQEPLPRRPASAARGSVPVGGRLHVVVGPPVRQYLSRMARRGSALDPEVAQFREMWADELGGAALYRALADHADERRRPIFLALAEAEERHAAHWAGRLREAGIGDLKPPRLPFRIRVLRRLARLVGTEAVLPIVLRAEAADADKYRSIAAAPAAMAAQEQMHGKVVAAMRGGGTAGGRIAAAEGRHRAGTGGALRATVFGINDGLVSNFSLVMGVAGGTTTNSIVVLAGVAGLVAGAFSMASGEWISIRSQRELYENELRIEQEELRAFPEEEREELELIYQAKGIAPDAARLLVDNIMRRGDVALDTLAREELGLDPTK